MNVRQFLDVPQIWNPNKIPQVQLCCAAVFRQRAAECLLENLSTVLLIMDDECVVCVNYYSTMSLFPEASFTLASFGMVSSKVVWGVL